MHPSVHIAVVGVLVAFVAAAPAFGKDDTQTAAPKPCSVSTAGGATINNWCGPAKATLKFAGKRLSIKGGVCGPSGGFWTLNVGKFTVPPAKPKFTYFGAAAPKAKPGTYKSGQFTISFQLPGKSYALQGGPAWGVPWPKVTITAGAKKGTFSGHAYASALGKGQPVSGSWSC